MAKEEMKKKNMVDNVINEVQAMSHINSEFIVHLFYSLQTDTNILLVSLGFCTAVVVFSYS